MICTKDSWRKSKKDECRRSMARAALRNEKAQRKAEMLKEQVRLSEFAKLASVSMFLEQNNTSTRFKIGRAAEGEGLAAEAVRQIMKSVGMEVSGQEAGAAAEMGTSTINLEAVPPKILKMLRSTIGKLQESQARAEEVQAAIDVLTKKHAEEGCAACERRSDCQANGCKGSACKCEKECSGEGNCPTVCQPCYGRNEGSVYTEDEQCGDNMCLAQFVSAGYVMAENLRKARQNRVIDAYLYHRQKEFLELARHSSECTASTPVVGSEDPVAVGTDEQLPGGYQIRRDQRHKQLDCVSGFSSRMHTQADAVAVNADGVINVH